MKTEVNITCLEELTAETVRIFEDLRNGKIPAKEATEFSNTVGKITGALKVKLAYHAMRGEAPDIPFIAGSTPVRALPGGALLPLPA